MSEFAANFGETTPVKDNGVKVSDPGPPSGSISC